MERSRERAGSATAYSTSIASCGSSSARSSYISWIDSRVKFASWWKVSAEMVLDKHERCRGSTGARDCELMTKALEVYGNDAR